MDIFSSGTRYRRLQRGLSLLELLLVLAVAVILAAVAVPSMTSFVGESRLSSVTNRLELSLKSARSEAMKRGLPAVLCPSADRGTATPSCTAGGYGDGWIVYVDGNRDGAWNAGEPIVLQETLDGASIGFAPDPTIAARVRFDGAGNHVDDGQTPLAAALTLRVASGSAREITIDSNGRTSVHTLAE